jgi:flagellar hook-associated protein 1 FlgK
MGSLTSLTDLATGALASDTYALNVTANNVANQNTPGYTREVVNWQVGDTVTINGDAYSAAPVTSATSQRDRVLDQRVQQQTQAESASAARSSVLTQVQGIFNLSSSSTSAGSTPIGTDLNSLFGSFTALSASPSDSATQQQVLSAAGSLATDLNSASSQLSSIGVSIGQQLTTAVTQVNALTQSIAALNGQITAQDPNTDAGVLEDQRQQDITTLSGLVGLDQITTQGNGITLTTTGGTQLVAGDTSANLSVGQVGGSFQVQDSTGTDISAATGGGSVGGLLTAQNTDLPTAVNALDTLAYSLGSAVNTQNEAGFTSSGTAGQAIFALPSTSTGASAGISVIPTSVTAIASAGTGEGTSGNTNALALANLVNTVNASGATFTGTYAALLGQIGSTAAAVTQQNTTQQSALTALTTQRDSLSAVSLDEEASNLTVYQRSYEAAAKLFTVANTIMTSALNLGEETTVS